MSGADLYALLGVPAEVEEEGLKRAYRALAKQYHPDLNPDPEAEDRFKAIALAYRVLSNPTRRGLYDRFGAASLEEGFDAARAAAEGVVAGGGAAKGGATEGAGGGRERAKPSLAEMLGRGGVAREEARGEDIFEELVLPMSRVPAGAMVRLRYQQRRRCGECGGSGARAGAKVRVCGACNGLGRVKLGQGGGSCQACGGSGQRVEARCGGCGGHGVVTVEASVKLRVPPETPEGATLRAAKRGHQGRVGEPGDLVATLRLENDTVFVRHGEDLWLTVPVTVAEAGLGAQIEVMTLYGLAPLRVPAGSSGGAQLWLRGAGLPRAGGGRGDQVVALQIVLPPRLDEGSRELLARFAALNPGSPRPW